jgi:hypothetical protein
MLDSAGVGVLVMHPPSGVKQTCGVETFADESEPVI